MARSSASRAKDALRKRLRRQVKLLDAHGLTPGGWHTYGTAKTPDVFNGKSQLWYGVFRVTGQPHQFTEAGYDLGVMNGQLDDFSDDEESDLDPAVKEGRKKQALTERYVTKIFGNYTAVEFAALRDEIVEQSIYELINDSFPFAERKDVKFMGSFVQKRGGSK